MMTIRPRNDVSLTGRSDVENSVDQMQNRENRARMVLTTILGAPSQMRVADSLSYLRIMSSADALSSTAAAVSAVCDFFFADIA